MAWKGKKDMAKLLIINPGSTSRKIWQRLWQEKRINVVLCASIGMVHAAVIRLFQNLAECFSMSRLRSKSAGLSAKILRRPMSVQSLSYVTNIR